MSRKVFEIIEDTMNRRVLLQRMAAALSALLVGVLGAPKLAYATTFQENCCQLCKNPASCSYSGCTCEWSWMCCFPPNPCVQDWRKFKCHECIQTPINPCKLPCWNDADCGNYAQCPGVKCSKSTVVQGASCPGVLC